jgi:hypothetical protein
MQLVQRYRNWRHEKDLKEIERIRGWAVAPARTMRQIAANIEPWGHRVRDTLPVPHWNLSAWDWIWAGGLLLELTLQRRLLR